MLADQDRLLIEELELQSLSEEAQIQYLESFYRTLDLTVCMTVKDMLSEEQLAEFERLSDAGESLALDGWLHKSIPDYQSVAERALAQFKQSIKQSTARLLSATQ